MALSSVAHHEQDRVTVGVDSHRDTHSAGVKNARGATVGEAQFAACAEGYEALERWALAFGEVEAFGIEGTGHYAAELTRFLLARGYKVVEVNRPDRKARRLKGKSDPVDAEAAARSVQAGEATAVPKSGDGHVEMIRMLKVVRDSAIKNRTQAINEMKSLIVTAPDGLRAELRSLSTPKLIAHCAAWLGDIVTPTGAVQRALGLLARRIQVLKADIETLDVDIETLVAERCPALLALHGVGPQSAAQFLITAGDNAERIRSEASLAMVCGAAPIPASSGMTTRHRLNRGGDRQANAALHRVIVVRLGSHAPTQDYLERRTKQGKTKREIIRCLKRLLVREIYAALRAKPAEPELVAA